MKISARQRSKLTNYWTLKCLIMVGSLAMAPAVHAANYVEAISGDLSGDSMAPTDIGSLALGSNYIVAATIPSGPIVDPVTGARAVEDNDYLTFTVATGNVLSKLVLNSDSIFVPGDRMFMGIAEGVGVNVDPTFASAKGLLGWTLVGNAAAGTDILPALGLAAPGMFPPIGGATHFTGPLGAGTYTLWMVDGDQPAAYSLNLFTSGVPEPATWAMMVAGFGLVGSALRRHRRSAAAGVPVTG